METSTKREEGVGARINKATNNELKLVYDMVAVESSAQICADAFGKDGGVYCSLLDPGCPRSDVRSEFFMGYSMSGESYIFEKEYWEARPDMFEFAAKFAEVADQLWQQGKWRAHPQRVEPGGLLGVTYGLQQGRDGKISGEKIVYRVDDTEWPSA
jgi:hypothetical protein